MKSFLFIVCLFFFFFSFFKSNAQVQTLLNDKTELKTLTQRWELDSTTQRGTFLITPYKPIYILPIVWSSNPNEQPYSGNKNPDYISPNGVNYNNIEAKFQLSFKTKILQDIFWGHGDLWLAYTQISLWQIYNDSLSRPFRETNFQPELILNIPVKLNLLGFKIRMIGVEFSHESNGKSIPFSRSWNRIIFFAGLDRKNWTIYIRPWLRLNDVKDDNPDISQYIGCGELNVIYSKNGNIFSIQATHNFDLKSKLRGNTTFSWAYPIKGNLKGYLQVSSGFGQSLIDYNNKQTTIGVGVSLIDWL